MFVKKERTGAHRLVARLRHQRGAVPLRVALLTAVGLVVVGAVGWFAWDTIDRLESQVAGLEERLDESEARADESEARAAAARRRAAAAEGRAERAESQAEEAREEALDSEEARIEAEEARRRALASADVARQEAQEAEAEAERIREEREAELQRMQQALERIVDTRRTALGLVMNLGEDRVQFDFDEAHLRPAGRELLSRIAGVLLASPEGYVVQVYGHTDDVGSAQYNQELSERRARSVRDYLVEVGIPADIIVTKGFGKSQPLVEGTDEASRQRNRRVELGIVDTMVEYRGAADDDVGGGDGREKEGG